MTIQNYRYEDILLCLNRIDSLFPVPLSQKQSLEDFARKLLKKGTICAQWEAGEIVSIVAGYTDEMREHMAFFSIAATLPQAQGKGYISRLFRAFLEIAREKGAVGAHLYAHPDNIHAIGIYRRLGFVDYHPENEPRPEDVHLVFWFDKENENECSANLCRPSGLYGKIF